MNFDIRQSGQISYEVHSSVTGLMSLVNTFIQQQDDEDFVGTWMMVANFKETPQDGSIDNRVRKLTVIRCTLIYTFCVDKQFSRHHHHKWKPILCRFHIPMWCIVK